MGQLLSQFAIIGQQDQALAVSIKPADGENSFVRRHQIDNAWPALRVTVGGDETDRLVDCKVNEFLFLQQPAVDTNLLDVGIDGGSKFGHHGTVDFNATGLDQLFA